MGLIRTVEVNQDTMLQPCLSWLKPCVLSHLHCPSPPCLMVIVLSAMAKGTLLLTLPPFHFQQNNKNFNFAIFVIYLYQFKIHFPPNLLSSKDAFLDASTYLYMRVCPSIRPSVRQSVSPSVSPPKFSYFPL